MRQTVLLFCLAISAVAPALGEEPADGRCAVTESGSEQAELVGAVEAIGEAMGVDYPSFLGSGAVLTCSIGQYEITVPVDSQTVSVLLRHKDGKHAVQIVEGYVFVFGEDGDVTVQLRDDEFDGLFDSLSYWGRQDGGSRVWTLDSDLDGLPDLRTVYSETEGVRRFSRLEDVWYEVACRNGKCGLVVGTDLLTKDELLEQLAGAEAADN